MNRANKKICQKMAVDILNSALILLKKESNRYEKSRVQAGKHLLPLTLKGIDLMEEAFKPILPEMYKIYLSEMKNHHAAIVSKKSAGKREYTVIIPRDDNMGSDLECAHVVIQKRKGSHASTYGGASEVRDTQQINKDWDHAPLIHNSTVAQSISRRGYF